MGVDGGEPGLRALLSGPARPPLCTDADAAYPHDHLSGYARLWAHLGYRRHPGRDLPGPALRNHLWHADAGGHRGWGRRAVDNWRAARYHRELYSGLLHRHWVQ